LRALERDAKSQRDLLESYLAKLREATARDSIGAGSPDARVISTAIVSNTPSWPKKIPTILIATLGMFTISVGFIVSGELMRATAAGPAMTVAPSPDRLDEKPISAALAGSPTVAGIAMLQIENLARELAAAGDTGRGVIVLGVNRDRDTSPVAIALARSLGETARVVMVDLAHGTSGLPPVAADPAAPGISEHILGTASLTQIITRDRLSRIHVIATGRAAGDPAAIMGSPRLATVIEALARSYDHVVINGGALSEMPADQLTQLASGAILIADARDSPGTAVAHLRLVDARMKTLSVLQSTPSSASDSTGSRVAA
jgi:hypothetical protein